MTDKLLAMIGEPYEEPEGCLTFLKRALAELGVEIEGTMEAYKRDFKLFRKVDRGHLGTMIVWKLFGGEHEFHVGLMLDQRWALQSSKITNGVGRVEITRAPWATTFRGFYRPRALLCSV